MIIKKRNSEKEIAAWQESRRKGISKYRDRVRAEGKKKKINPVSPQLSLLKKAYTELIKVLKPQHPICDHCRKSPATEVHHMKGRRGILLIMSQFFKYLCHECHRFATDNSEEAKNIGLSLPINSKTNYEFTQFEMGLIEKYGIRLPVSYSIINE